MKRRILLSWPRGYRTFFILVLKLALRTPSMCSTEYDSKNRDYKSFGVRSPLSTIWSKLQKPMEEILRLWSKIEHSNSCK